MEQTLRVLNELEQAGGISRYAIGGAMAAAFYAEPVVTFDLDIFVLLPKDAAGLLSLTAMYETLRSKGYEAKGEFVDIEGVAVQFLPAYNALVEEALNEARPMGYESIETRVLRAEHLTAIALQTGRDKDRQRVRLLLEQAKLDADYLNQILNRHDLMEKWKQWSP